MNGHQPRHVFISYVRENQEQVDRLCQDLERYGVKVWLDRKSIKPGARWKDAIREAIRHGDFFIACFSIEYDAREQTYMNEELSLAIEELKQYITETDRTWFIPLLLSKCKMPEHSIGGEETLLDIENVQLYEDWDAGIQKILSVIKPIPLKIQILISALRSEDKDVRRRAADALGKIGSGAKVSVPALIKVFKEDEGVRWSAANALRRIGPEAKAAVPALIEFLIDKGINGRNVAWVLGGIGTEAGPALIEVLKDKNKNQDVRLSAALALGYMGPTGKAAVPALTEAIKDKDDGISGMAMWALWNIEPEAMGKLNHKT